MEQTRKCKFKRLVILITLVVLLAACSKDTPNHAEQNMSANTIRLTEPGTFPIVEGDPVELTVLTRADARMEDIRTNAFTKYYEELTNVKINWEVAPEGGLVEALNLRLSTGDLPDIIMGMPIDRAQQKIYGEQGVFLDLSELYEEHGSISKEMFERNPHVLDFISSQDGKFYTLPQVSECDFCVSPVNMWIYEPWLEQLGLDMPETTEQFYDVLRAFRDQDPTGHGGVIPLAGSPAEGLLARVEQFLMNAFVYTPPERLYLSNGKVEASFMQPGWKEGLKYLHKLYAEGLLAEESFTMDRQQLTQLGEHPEYAVLGAVPGGYQGYFTEIGSESNRYLEYVMVPPLEGPDGTRQAVHSPYGIVATDVITSSALAHKEVAFRWLEGLYFPEVTLQARRGVPGVDWVEADEGMVGLDGRPAKIKVITQYGKSSNNHWFSIGPFWYSEDATMEVAVEDRSRDINAILFDQLTAKYVPHLADIETVLPPLLFDEEQSMEVADLKMTIMNYVDEMIAKFVLGQADIEQEWSQYLETLEEMNVSRYIALHQQAFDSKDPLHGEVEVYDKERKSH
ncbi:extracellular solute-binding protein [Paenibacillus arenilitoris]|uniref:Extracellular solute-binding protein n=1 Tax=Paenibacillus arenilitoris TaxID=2772299 RepID=A0A927CMM2_9BACL|nr:extracellular solute-binding protein [Paenibacillus arenilitoris]MBD2868956.1 extracellular solute-binding protein [Paenibacillus arenilitoris]